MRTRAVRRANRHGILSEALEGGRYVRVRDDRERAERRRHLLIDLPHLDGGRDDAAFAVLSSVDVAVFTVERGFCVLQRVECNLTQSVHK